MKTEELKRGRPGNEAISDQLFRTTFMWPLKELTVGISVTLYPKLDNVFTTGGAWM